MNKLSLCLHLLCVLAILSSCKRRQDGGGVTEKGGELAWSISEGADGAPISLTASDGTGLRLVGLDAKAVVEGPLAFTELRLKFLNPEDRVREGRFEITLPPGASVSRFAMRINDRWQEAEVVERQKAQVAYEDFLHRKQDPALLEKKAGNQFGARVFPIPARGEKELIVSYSETLIDAPYTLRIAGMPKIEHLAAEVRFMTEKGKAVVYRSAGEAVTPTGNLKTPILETDKAKWVGLRNGNLAVVKVVPELDTSVEPITNLTVLFDTSASRALGFDGQLRRVRDLLAALEAASGSDFDLTFVCFDQEVFPVYRGKVSGFDETQLKKIADRGAFGASNLKAALEWLETNEKPRDRLLIVTDGIVTAGESAEGTLRGAIEQLGKQGLKRVDTVVDGGIRNEPLLRALTTARLPKAGVMVEGTAPKETLVRKLTRSTLTKISVTAPGADWVWPQELHGVQSGDAFLVYVSLNERAPLRIELPGLTGEARTVETSPVSLPLLERSSVGAQIEMVLGQLDDIKDEEKKAALKNRIVELSVAHRVLSDYTALLVLETERDYARFGIDRNAPVDILTVGERGVELMHRDGLRIAEDEPQDTRARKTGDRHLSQPSEERQVHRKEGQMGHRDSARTQNRYGIHRGPEDNLARGMEPAVEPSPSALPVEPRAALPSLGRIEDGQGEGLGLRGTGRGGGGTGEGTISLENLNTIGHGGGGGSGSGYGRGTGGIGRRHHAVPRIRTGTVEVRGALSREVVRRIVHRHLNEVKFCYERPLSQNPSPAGRVTIKFIISGTGAVQMAAVAQSTLGNPIVENCIADAVRRWTFPQPEGGGIVIVNHPFELSREEDLQHDEAGSGETPGETDANLPPLFQDTAARARELEKQAVLTAYEGKFKEIMELLSADKTQAALNAANKWRAESPGDLLALVALGEAFEKKNDLKAAARAYGSVIDLYPSRADMRRMAGERLERLKETAAELTVDTYRCAVEQRPDHPSSHRLYAWALFRDGKYQEAFDALRKGVEHAYPDGRFAGVVEEMRRELGLMATGWKQAVPEAAKQIETELKEVNVPFETNPVTRFVLQWESDANDVDLHVYDKTGGHAFYSEMIMPSGGSLAADVTTGYGPEYFTIEGVPKAYPYTLQAHYYNRGPMGYGMGTLHIIVHDGKGRLSFDFRPFIVMKDDAYVGLGVHEAPRKAE